MGLSPINKRLIKVYGDTVHFNDSNHLDGGIEEDGAWQQRWQSLTALPCQRYNVPSGKVGRRFIELFTKELDGVVERQWNSERFIVFPIVILQRLKGTTASHDICWRIDHRLDLWEQGEHEQLCEHTIAICKRQIPANQKHETQEH
eukprot:2059504-Ditylum_brightwellii.AAC.1